MYREAPMAWILSGTLSLCVDEDEVALAMRIYGADGVANGATPVFAAKECVARPYICGSSDFRVGAPLGQSSGPPQWKYTPEAREELQAISLDMWPPYINACPQDVPDDVYQRLWCCLVRFTGPLPGFIAPLFVGDRWLTPRLQCIAT
jgi:hypothetical protein